MALLAVFLIVLSQWFGWATWRRVPQPRLRPRVLVGQLLCSAGQLCLLGWLAICQGWLRSNDLLANPSGGLLAHSGLLLQAGGLWMFFWLTSGLVLGWKREGSRERKSTAFTLTVALLSHTLLTFIGPLAALAWLSGLRSGLQF